MKAAPNDRKWKCWKLASLSPLSFSWILQEWQQVLWISSLVSKLSRGIDALICRQSSIRLFFLLSQSPKIVLQPNLRFLLHHRNSSRLGFLFFLQFGYIILQIGSLLSDFLVRWFIDYAKFLDHSFQLSQFSFPSLTILVSPIVFQAPYLQQSQVVRVVFESPMPEPQFLLLWLHPVPMPFSYPASLYLWSFL